MRVHETGRTTSFVIQGEGVSDTRDLTSLSQDLARYLPEYTFSPENLIYNLRSRFPHGILNVLEGGCGVGALLVELKNTARRLKVPINTTGITLDPEHPKRARNSNIDLMVVGNVQDYFRSMWFKPSYHLVIDYYGALSYDWPPFGRSVLPVYYEILKPGGTAIVGSTLVLGLLNPIAEIAERNSYIASCGFEISASNNGFAILRK